MNRIRIVLLCAIVSGAMAGAETPTEYAGEVRPDFSSRQRWELIRGSVGESCAQTGFVEFSGRGLMQLEWFAASNETLESASYRLRQESGDELTYSWSNPLHRVSARVRLVGNRLEVTVDEFDQVIRCRSPQREWHLLFKRVK